MSRKVTLLVLVTAITALVALPALGQASSPSPEGGGASSEEDKREPTEYFVYAAVALLGFLLLFIGAGYVRTAMKAAESE